MAARPRVPREKIFLHKILARVIKKGTSLMPVRLVETSRFLDPLYFLCSCGEKSSGEDVVFSL